MGSYDSRLEPCEVHCLLPYGELIMTMHPMILVVSRSVFFGLRKIGDHFHRGNHGDILTLGSFWAISAAQVLVAQGAFVLRRKQCQNW